MSPSVSLSRPRIALFTITSCLITALLFFIDEGNNNFLWMSNVASWIIFLIYAGLVLCGEILMSRVFAFLHFTGRASVALAIIAGTTIGLWLAVTVVFA